MATSKVRKQSFNAWYTRNKEKFNQLRREKYHSTPELREKYVERQRGYRKSAAVVGKPRLRKIDGMEVEVFRIGYTSKVVGRSEDVIRRWESEKIIPKPLVLGGKHRYYTKVQVLLMKELAELMDVLKGDPETYNLAIVKKSGEIHLLWGN